MYNILIYGGFMDDYLSELSADAKLKVLMQCFKMDIRLKKEFRHKELFRNTTHQLVNKNIFFLSKEYLDRYASIAEKNLYYIVTGEYVKAIPNLYKRTYVLYKQMFDYYMEDKCFDYEIVYIINNYNLRLEELLECPEKYANRFATQLEREKYLAKKKNLNITELKYKYYYNLLESKGFNYQEIVSFGNYVNIPSDYIFRMAAMYCEKVLKKRCPESLNRLYYYNYKYKHGSQVADLVFIKLEFTETSEDIIKLLKYSNISIDTLYAELRDYIERYKNYLDPQAKNVLREKLLKKIDIYADTLRDESLDSNLSFEEQEAVLTIQKYLHSRKSKEKFCQDELISYLTFDNYLKTFLEHNIKVLTPIEERRLRQVNNLNSNDITDVLNKIVDGLQNGIAIDDQLLKFELLDYYKITKIPYYAITDLAKGKVSKSKYLCLLNFALKHKNEIMISDKNKEAVLSEKIVLNVSFDANNMPIADSGHEVTMEEKLEVLDELQKQNIPLYYSNYMIAIRRKYLTNQKQFKKKK